LSQVGASLAFGRGPGSVSVTVPFADRAPKAGVEQVTCSVYTPYSEGEMNLFLQILLIVASLLLILLVLLHRGRGGGLSSLFGGGMQSSLSGSSVVEKNLDRITLFVAAIWIISIIGIGLLAKLGG
jgi:preprotein translocase subunit SecG